MQKHPAPIAKFLTGKTQKLAPLLSEAKRITQIKILLNQSLDHEMVKHIQVSRVENNQLRLIVDSPAWATRLRYKQEEIINRFKNYAISKTINSIHIKINPSVIQQTKIKPKTNDISLSTKSANLMLDEISVIEDENLRDALIRLTKHAK